MSDQSIFPEWRSFLGSSSDKETWGVIKNVVKRSGEIAKYDRKKIETAIDKAIEAVEGRKDPDRAASLTSDWKWQETALTQFLLSKKFRIL